MMLKSMPQKMNETAIRPRMTTMIERPNPSRIRCSMAHQKRRGDTRLPHHDESGGTGPSYRKGVRHHFPSPCPRKKGVEHPFSAPSLGVKNKGQIRSRLAGKKSALCLNQLAEWTGLEPATPGV